MKKVLIEAQISAALVITKEELSQIIKFLDESDAVMFIWSDETDEVIIRREWVEG